MAKHDREPRDDELRDRISWLLAVIETRREQADSFAWTVPGLAIAGQAFLLSIALDPGTQALGRLLASIAGIVALLATAHLMAKQAYNFDVYEAVIERDREKLGRPGVQMDALIDPQHPFPPNTSYMKRRWSTEHLWRHRLVVRTKAVRVWGLTLAALLAIDVFIAVYSILAMSGADPGWLS